MKFKLKDKKLSLSMVIIVILSLIVTGIIVVTIVKQANVTETKPWFFQQSIDTHEAIRLEDVYIISNDEGVLKFIHNKETYTVEGNLADSFLGVADILVEEGAITRVYAKPDATEGVLLRYTDSDIVMESGKDVETDAGADAGSAHNINRKTTVPVYQIINGEVQEMEWDSLIVGTSVVKAVMENGQVSALIVEEEVVPSNVNVLIRNGDSIFHQNVYIRKVYENTLVSVEEVLNNNNETVMTLTDQKGLVLCDKNNNPLGEAYEGEFQIFKTGEGLVLVNKLGVENYLKYVIPSEMPKAFSHEALKAQAVCARTYAYAQMKNGAYAQYGANLDDTTDYQVYHAYGRFAETDAAVEETKGEVITCAEELITCYYFSTSSGMTNDFSVWGGVNADYITITGAENITGLDLSKASDFSEFINSTYASNDSDSPYYRWEATLNTEAVKEASYGKLNAIKIVERNKSGYITELLLDYEKKDITLTKEHDIRKTLGRYLLETNLNDGQKRTDFALIPSVCFEIVSNAEGKLVIRGGGYGHGIGLSQYGANKMAQDGKTYEEIIKYYFSNVDIGEL